MAAAMSPSLIMRSEAPTRRISATILSWRGRSSIMTTTSCTRLFNAFATVMSVSSIGLSSFKVVDARDLHAPDHVRAVGQLHHVKRRDVAERDLHSLLRAGGRDAGDRVGRAFGDVGRAVDRIERDVELRRARQPHPELFAFENTGRVVLDPFADHDFAADVHEVEHPADRVAGGVVGFFFFAAAEPGKGIERGGFRCADEIEFDDALDVVVVLLWDPHRVTFAKVTVRDTSCYLDRIIRDERGFTETTRRRQL